MKKLFVICLIIVSLYVSLLFIYSANAQIPFDFYPNVNSPPPREIPEPRKEDIDRYRVPAPPYPNYYIQPYTYWHPDIANPNIANPNIGNPHIPNPNIAKPNPGTPNIPYEGMQFIGFH